MKVRKIIFLTGTRADFGKMKPLIEKIEHSKNFENYIFVTGMHTLSKYGATFKEVKKQKFRNIYVYMNQTHTTDQDVILANTILGFSNFVKEINPDMIVVHGDRIEALAGSIVGALNHILVAHIEGGEISGTIDESMRHAITKLSHIHFVANSEARRRLIQLGERKDSIFIIGSPDIEVMKTENLPSIRLVKKYYGINFNDYGILIFHPVSSELDTLKEQTEHLLNAVIKSDKNYIVIYPNNDEGSDVILHEYERLRKHSNFKIYPSIRFQYFLTLLKNAKFIIGNSSAGVRESEVYGIPTIDIGTRQNNRYTNKDIIHVKDTESDILKAISMVEEKKIKIRNSFGQVLNSRDLFYKMLKSDRLWKISNQKQFIDLKLPKDLN